MGPFGMAALPVCHCLQLELLVQCRVVTSSNSTDPEGYGSRALKISGRLAGSTRLSNRHPISRQGVRILAAPVRQALGHRNCLHGCGQTSHEASDGGGTTDWLKPRQGGITHSCRYAGFLRYADRRRCV